MIALRLMVLLVAAPGPKSDAPLAPLAVMPFKNLNRDPKLDWLSLGIAETMTVDLEKGSRLEVVERDQLNHALAELALQGLKATDESSAAKLGKMVGARTVVLGSYQEVGRALRIVARMVDVQTGVIRDAAKVTGDERDIFELQDDIVVKLAGTPFTDAVKRHRRKQEQQQKPGALLAAYRLYAQSFTIMSDAERAVVLQNALKEDPDFTYAADDLLDLQDRIKRLSQAHEVEVTKQLANLRAKAHDAKADAPSRLSAAMQLIGNEMGARRYHAVLRDTEWIIPSDLPKDAHYQIRAFALFQRALAYQKLAEDALEMQVFENLMELYPSSVYFTGAQAMLNVAAGERARQLEKDRTYAAKLELARNRIQKQRDTYAKYGRAAPAYQEFEWQDDICELMATAGQYHDAARCFQKMLDHPIDELSLKERYWGVRVELMRAASSAGEFELARRTGEQFQKDAPDAALRFSVPLQLSALPAD